MKYFLLAAYLFITYNSLIVMYKLVKDVANVFDMLQTTATCIIWTTLLIIAGKFIYSCLKTKQ
jgi:hypothetical protein